MRIRTTIDLYDAITNELAWRKKELTAVKANVHSARKFAKKTAMRAGITLLYAHWEGSIKNIAGQYLEHVSLKKLKYSQLKPNFLAITVHSNLQNFHETKKMTLHTETLKKILTMQNETSRIPYKSIISADSNLNSKVFVQIMATIGLDCKEYEIDYNFIDETLLGMRNQIAHGERLENISLDENRYYQIHSKVLKLIDLFSTQISNAAAMKSYCLQQIRLNKINN